MKSLLALAAVLALAAARPEKYKETEDFQYSRSSTDEGSKSGFYGAQRGNMGGNYERAHNMDGLAQHQMGTAVKQVEGELGEAAKLKSGSVFTSANSGGMFGSGHYDLSGVQGRNFQDSGSSYGAGESLSSLSSHHSGYQDQLSSSSLHNSGFDSSAHNADYRRYQGVKGGQASQIGNLQTADVHDGNYELGTHGAASSHGSGYSSQSGYQSHSAYGSSDDSQLGSHSAYATNPQHRLIYTTPVKIVGRPGSRVAVPLAVQTYDATHSAASHSASTQAQNAYNNEAEILLSRPAQPHISYRPAGGDAKHYESAYSYQKQWEKHDEQPQAIALIVPTENPFPKNSELIEDDIHSQSHASGYNSRSGYSSHANNAYNTKSSSAALSHQSAASQHSDSAFNANANSHGAYTGSSVDTANAINGIDTKPKSYQSAYSYHKAWERQGDPYVIKPVGEAYTGEDLQRLTSASKTHMSSSYQNSADQAQHYSQGSNGVGECCVTGYRRVARSIRGQDERDLGQQVQQTQFENLEDITQQIQQAQSGWEIPANLRQRPYARSQVLQGYEDTQQVQQQKWDRLEDLGQVQQKKWENMDQLQQRHSDQGVLNTWPEDISGLQKFDKHEQHSNSFETAWKQGSSENFGSQKHQSNNFEFARKPDSREQQSNSFDSAWTQEKGENQEQQSQNFSSSWRQEASQSFENQEQHSHNFDTAWKPASSEFQSKLDEQQETKQITSSDFNQVQQSVPNMWFSQAQQVHDTNVFKNQSSYERGENNGFESFDHTYLQPQEHEESEQQASKPWGSYGYLDQVNKINANKQEAEIEHSSSWVHSNNNPEHSTYIPSSRSYHEQRVQSDNGSFGFYDWSRASGQSGPLNTQLSSLWDKISNIDGMPLGSDDFQRTGKDQENTDKTVSKYDRSQQSVTSLNTAYKLGNNKTKSEEMFQTDLETSGTTEKSTQQVASQSTAHQVASQKDDERGDIGPEKTPKSVESPRDLGRGDIGPENDYDDQPTINTIGKPKPKNLTKENNNLTADQGQIATQNVGWTSTEQKVESQDVIPFDMPQKKLEQTSQQQSTSYSFSGKEFRPVDSEHGEEDGQLEQSNQNILQNWQQAENFNDTVWGQQSESSMQITQQQQKAESFGVLINEEQQSEQLSEGQLAENFRKDSEKKLDDVYVSNHNLPHYHEKLSQQRPEKLQTLGTTIKIQTPSKNARDENPLEPTSKPGFWTSAKNKFVSWFKSS